MAESWGQFVAGLPRKVTGGESSIPDDEQPQTDFPFNTIRTVRIDGNTVDPSIVTDETRAAADIPTPAEEYEYWHGGDE